MPISLPNMADRKASKRPEQKSFTLKGARVPYESWCLRNGYDERTIMLAGWFAMSELSHDDRRVLFRAVEIAESKPGGSDFGDATIATSIAQAREEDRKRKEELTAARTAEGQKRPVETTPTRPSRRATA